METDTAKPVSKPRRILRRLKQSSFIKNIFIVMSGTVVAQSIGFALLPVISRLFSPSDFGVFGSFSAVLSVIMSIVSFDYTQAIMLPKQKSDAMNLFFISCLSTLVVTSTCLLFCLLFPSTANGLMKTTGFAILVLLIIGVLVTGVYQSCSAWCIRVKAFRTTATSQIVRSLTNSGTQMGMGFLKCGSYGLILALILAEILATFNLLKILIPDIKNLRHEIKWLRMKQLMKEYRDFPLYSATPNLIDALSRGLPVLLLTYFYGVVIAGAYAFSVRIMQAPTAIITNSLRQVLFQKASEVNNTGGLLLPLYLKTTAGLLGMAIIPALILVLWAAPIFTFIFGSQWHTAGQFSSFLILWVAVMFCNTPAILFSRIIRIQKEMFLWQLFMHITRIVALIISGMYLSVLPTIIVFSLVGVFMNILVIFMVGYNLMKREGVSLSKGILNLSR